MKECYEIEKQDLLNLLESAHRLAALKQGGVDNWEGYYDSEAIYLRRYQEWNFASLARNDLQYYNPI